MQWCAIQYSTIHATPQPCTIYAAGAVRSSSRTRPIRTDRGGCSLRLRIDWYVRMGSTLLMCLKQYVSEYGECRPTCRPQLASLVGLKYTTGSMWSREHAEQSRRRKSTSTRSHPGDGGFFSSSISTISSLSSFLSSDLLKEYFFVIYYSILLNCFLFFFDCVSGNHLRSLKFLQLSIHSRHRLHYISLFTQNEVLTRPPQQRGLGLNGSCRTQPSLL